MTETKILVNPETDFDAGQQFKTDLVIGCCQLEDKICIDLMVTLSDNSQLLIILDDKD
jgi:hypothetical protein